MHPSSSFTPTAEILYCSVILASTSVPFGAVNSGQLVVRGYLQEVELTKAQGWKNTWIINNKNFSTSWSITAGIGSANRYCDDILEMKALGQRSGLVVAWGLALGSVVGKVTRSITQDTFQTYRLVLIKSELSSGSYRRVGI